MKVYNSIENLKDDLRISSPSIHPEFHLFSHNELSEREEDVRKPHKKKFFSIEFLVDESWTLKNGHKTFENMNNCLLFNYPMQLFSVEKYDHDSQCRGFTILFTADFFITKNPLYLIQKEYPFLKLSSYCEYPLENRQVQILSEIMEIMYKEILDPDDCSVEIVRSYLLILLNTIKRMIWDTPTLEKPARSDEITSQFEELLLKESAGLKTVADYASKLNITPAYLSDCTKKSTGLSAKRILLNDSILRAKSYLKQTDWSIDEIALEMGFTETTNFIKRFKKSEGLTPHMYRKKPE